MQYHPDSSVTRDESSQVQRPTGQPARRYEHVTAEMAGEMSACSDCGAVVWSRGKHDNLHTQIDGLIGTSWRHSDLLDSDEQRLDDHAGQIAAIQGQVGDLQSSTYRLDDAVRDVGYRADEAQRAAERAADSSSRGW